jgi:hypothetical protein
MLEKENKKKKKNKRKSWKFMKDQDKESKFMD